MGAAGHAQEVGDADEADIVVTGAGMDTTGLNLQPRQTPQSVTVLDNARMQEQGLAAISEVLDQVVGIQSNRSGALGTDGTNYVARGFAVQNYQVDGVARPASVYGFAEDTADMIAYDRIEVVRGSAGLMTGVGQPSASINMIRKKPSASFKANVGATAGSWGLRRMEADIGGPLTSDGSLSLRVAGAWQENDNFIDREHADRKAFYGVFEAMLTPDTALTLGVEYQNFRNAGASRGGFPLYFTDGAETDFARSTNTGAAWSDFSRESVSAFASLTQNLGPDWSLGIHAEHKSGSYDEIIGYFYGNIDWQTGEGNSLYSARWASDLKLDAVYANLQGSFEALGQKHQIAITASHARFEDIGPGYPGWWSGGDYRRTINAFDFFTTGGATKPNLETTGDRMGGKIENSAIAGVLRLKPVERLSLIGGARATWWKRENYYEDMAGIFTWTPDIDERGVLTPYAGAVLDITPTVSVYASYASIFEPQTKKTNEGDVLDPLKGNTYELGVKADLLDGRLSATAAVFRIKQSNFAQAAGPGIFAPDGSAAYYAVPGVKSSGYEVEVSGEVQPGWRVAGGFANARAKDTDGDPLRVEIPKNSFKLFTTYALQGQLEGLTLGGNLHWQSKTIANGTGPNGETFEQGSLGLVDLLASYRINKRFSLAVHVNNIFDKTYYGSLNATSSRYGTPRSFTATLRSQF